MMRQFENPTDVGQLAGDWYLLATLLGSFDAKPRIEEGAVHFEHAGNSMRFSLTYWTPRRSWRIRGKVPKAVSGAGLHNWTGRGGWLVASRLSWALAQSRDGSLFAAYNPGSMITNESLVFLAREGTPYQTAVETLKREACGLGLGHRELEDVIWRPGTRRLQEAGASKGA